MIDLHVHTTASDGHSEPAELARQAWLAGISVLAVTDHDTTAAVPAVITAGTAYGMTVVPGLEITAVAGGRDVHVLGYFIDPASPLLMTFLASQRADRVRRAVAIAGKLQKLGCTIDVSSLLDGAEAPSGQVVARPQIAAALMRAGHVGTVREAFDRLIGEGRPAYVPRRGASPAEVVAIIDRAGGVASLAHPGLLRRDDLIPALAVAGLAALEVYHSEHDEEMQARYRDLARRYDLAVTGGSDFHGDGTHRRAGLGSIGLSVEDYQRLCERARRGKPEPGA